MQIHVTRLNNWFRLSGNKWDVEVCKKRFEDRLVQAYRSRKKIEYNKNSIESIKVPFDLRFFGGDESARCYLIYRGSLRRKRRRISSQAALF